MNKIIEYLKLMRVKHYLKNGLIFLPILFSGQIFNMNKIIICLIGFVSFSLLASAIYCINDLKDVEKDKKHPIKRNRPIASGKITKYEAIIFCIILIFISLFLNLLLLKWVNNINNAIIAVIIEITYLILNVSYSFGLKNIPILDVVILVSGFLLRVLYGAQITEINISNWLYLTVMMGSFYMGFGKRRNETKKQGEKSRQVLEKYNKDFLDKFMYVSMILTIVFYSLWSIDENTVSRIGNRYMIWTIPLLFITLMKYSSDVEGDSYGDPVDVILGDKTLIILGILFAIVLLTILYMI